MNYRVKYVLIKLLLFEIADKKNVDHNYFVAYLSIYLIDGIKILCESQQCFSYFLNHLTNSIVYHFSNVTCSSICPDCFVIEAKQVIITKVIVKLTEVAIVDVIFVSSLPPLYFYTTKLL